MIELIAYVLVTLAGVTLPPEKFSYPDLFESAAACESAKLHPDVLWAVGELTKEVQADAPAATIVIKLACEPVT